MATKKTTKKQENLTNEGLINLYMNHVLENGATPVTVYKFCKNNNIKEDEFYNFYGSFEALVKGVWKRFFEHTLELMQKSSDYKIYSIREKLLTFYYTFFEILNVNRSYSLFALQQSNSPLKKLKQLSGLRRKVKAFAKDLAREENSDKQAMNLKKSETIFSEAVWLQLLFLLKFWKNDNSPGFESTDVAIEKSVNTLFDLFDTTPLERVFDLGKFLWKEKMS